MRYARVLAGLLCVTSAGSAWAGPVVRGAGAAAAFDSGRRRSIQGRPRAQQRRGRRIAAGRSPGNQLGRRRPRPHLRWESMTRFAGRGAIFRTPAPGSRPAAHLR